MKDLVFCDGNSDFTFCIRKVIRTATFNDFDNPNNVIVDGYAIDRHDFLNLITILEACKYVDEYLTFNERIKNCSFIVLDYRGYYEFEIEGIDNFIKKFVENEQKLLDKLYGV